MPEIEARNLHDIWFQQDGTTCHTAREAMDLLRSRFGEQFISRFGPVDWPPRSCDILPYQFEFSLFYFNLKSYTSKLITLY